MPPLPLPEICDNETAQWYGPHLELALRRNWGWKGKVLRSEGSLVYLVTSYEGKALTLSRNQISQINTAFGGMRPGMPLSR